MKQYHTFLFDAYSFDPHTGIVSLTYSLDDVHFTETLTLPREGMFLRDVPPDLLDRVLFLIHLIGGISYYKAACPETIVVRSGVLTREQADFWNTVYTKGLAEFFHRNGIDGTDLVRFPADGTAAPEPVAVPHLHHRVLIPIGGGKDSIVTTELIKAAQVDCVLFRIGAHPLITETARIAKRPLLTIERTLAPELFELNANGALNGHVPITAYLSAVCVLVALLYGFDDVAMSNERSANAPTISGPGGDVNHQWSKSIEFERMFQEYVRRFVTQDIHVFSVLRSLSELHISYLFAHHPQYFRCATSCNKNWKFAEPLDPAKRWCGKCPKCAFTFCQLAAFLPKQKMMEIFGRDLFSEDALLPTYRELLGLEGHKPFECVGTPDEVAAAFSLAVKNPDWESTPAVQMFLREKAELLPNVEALVQEVLRVDDEHAVPSRFLSRLDGHS